MKMDGLNMQASKAKVKNAIMAVFNSNETSHIAFTDTRISKQPEPTLKWVQKFYPDKLRKGDPSVPSGCQLYMSPLCLMRDFRFHPRWVNA